MERGGPDPDRDSDGGPGELRRIGELTELAPESYFL